MWVTMVVTWTTDEEHDIAIAVGEGPVGVLRIDTRVRARARRSTAIAALHHDLNRMSKEGRWPEMAALIPDDLVEHVAVVGPRGEIADKISARARGITDRVSLVNNRNPDPELFADIVGDLRALDELSPR